jgi:hypothetical protein
VIYVPVVLIVIVGLILLFSEYPFLLIPVGILIAAGIFYFVWRCQGEKINKNIREGVYKNAFMNFFKSGTWLQAVFIITFIAILLIGGYFLFTRALWLFILIFIVLAIIGAIAQRKEKGK